MKLTNTLRLLSILTYILLILCVWSIFDLDQTSIAQWMSEHVRHEDSWGIIIYIAIITVLIAMGVPRQICSFLGGYIFGLWQGTIFATIGTALACLICFYYARFVGNEWINKKYGHKLILFNDFICQSPFLLSLVVRIVPLGSNFLTNFLAGISHIPAKSFLGGSIIGFTAQNLIFAMMGSGLQIGARMNISYSIILYAISLSLAYWIFIRYKKYKQHTNIKS